MKKVLLAMLSLCLVFSSLALPAPSAAAATARETEDAVRALGIMIGDENGNMNLPRDVTRVEFVKLMVAASVYRDSVGETSGYSLFKDVKSAHWAAEYVRVAVNNGWVTGYVDGTFRPGNTITLEEAATALLRLLGYTPEDLSGAYPSAQLIKFNALGLGRDVTKTRGQTLTRGDCVQIFYNLMTAVTKGGGVYAAALGYKTDAAGALDYASIVSAGMKGPFILESGSLTGILPFSGANIDVYKNGGLSAAAEARAYDVCYYNSNLRTVWLVSRRVTGTLSAVTPNTAAPEAVTVAGISYAFGTSAAAYKVSSMGGLRVGDAVTLLLGMDGTAADVVPAAEINDVRIGVVTELKTGSYKDGNGNIVVANSVVIAATDGFLHTYYTGSAAPPVGAVVQAGYTGGVSEVKSLSQKGTGGTVNKAGTALGELAFAEDIEILDADSAGGWAVIPPARLSGAALKSADVRYYTLDGSGRLDRLILNNATGELYTYGILTHVSENIAPDDSFKLSGAYQYVIEGEKGAYTSSTTVYGVSVGGAAFAYDANGVLNRIQNLTDVAIDSISPLSAASGNKQYRLSSAVQVYIQKSGEYYPVGIEDVADTGRYTLRGWYDKFDFAAGGVLRVVVASAK
ncbi:MAG: S-layer homology domain-containing protein [Oscillospiraceae bacterium]|jgi:hypothetical protein|nr:S-layer homology domain-containing protein [Oscillospiraceae bacterium]